MNDRDMYTILKGQVIASLLPKFLEIQKDDKDEIINIDIDQRTKTEIQNFAEEMAFDILTTQDENDQKFDDNGYIIWDEV